MGFIRENHVPHQSNYISKQGPTKLILKRWNANLILWGNRSRRTQKSRDKSAFNNHFSNAKISKLRKEWDMYVLGSCDIISNRNLSHNSTDSSSMESWRHHNDQGPNYFGATTVLRPYLTSQPQSLRKQVLSSDERQSKNKRKRQYLASSPHQLE